MKTVGLPQPLRIFRIGILNQYSTESVEGHQVRVGANGELELFVIKGTISWLTAAYAPGRWTSVTVDAPSDEDIAAIETYLDGMETRAQQQAQMYGLAANALGNGNIGRA